MFTAMKRVFLLLFSGLLAALSPASGAEPPAATAGANPAVIHGKGLTVRLVCETASIQPGKPFLAGLWITHRPGYHTYWKNPGLAGVPTNMEWQLPEGFKAGPPLWEPPDKIKMATINTHGYERDVLLAFEITPPETLDAKTATLGGKASWMCCARECNPGFGTLTLTLPVSAEPPAKTEWAEKFAALRAAQPPAAEGWVFKAERRKNHITLTALPAPGSGVSAPESTPVFFSEDNLICSHPEQPWERVENGWRCVLTLSEFPPDDRSRLRGLLFAKSGWRPGGKAPYVRIDVPVESR